MSAKKKKPSDYPVLSFRIEADKKSKLLDLVSEARDKLNSKLSDDEKLWMQNDVIYEALLVGVPALLKKSKQKT
jgi:hypothetical protein